MYFTRPLSMYCALSCGNVVSLKCAQCGQVSEAYSMMVTGALAAPMTMSSPSWRGASALGSWATVAWAMAEGVGWDSAARAAGVAARAVKPSKNQMLRVMVTRPTRYGGILTSRGTETQGEMRPLRIARATPWDHLFSSGGAGLDRRPGCGRIGRGGP